MDLSDLPANPILPKVITLDQAKPPTCPLKDILFIQLEKFKKYKEQASRMAEGFDQIGKKNMMRENREKRRKYEEDKKNKQGGREDDDAKMDEHTHFIQDIVYARDPKIFDTKNGLVN